MASLNVIWMSSSLKYTIQFFPLQNTRRPLSSCSKEDEYAFSPRWRQSEEPLLQFPFYLELKINVFCSLLSRLVEFNQEKNSTRIVYILRQSEYSSCVTGTMGKDENNEREISKHKKQRVWLTIYNFSIRGFHTIAYPPESIIPLWASRYPVGQTEVGDWLRRITSKWSNPWDSITISVAHFSDEASHPDCPVHPSATDAGERTPVCSVHRPWLDLESGPSHLS